MTMGDMNMSTRNDIHFAIDSLLKKFQESLESGTAEGALIILLDLMAATLLLDHKFRQNIKGFEGRYVFNSRDGSVGATAVFRHNRLEVWPLAITTPKANMTVSFASGKALMRFLLAGNPDIIGSMLRQEVSVEGNLNYLYKFAYMARHLQHMAMAAI